jgi:hypothetical protein
MKARNQNQTLKLSLALVFSFCLMNFAAAENKTQFNQMTFKTCDPFKSPSWFDAAKKRQKFFLALPGENDEALHVSSKQLVDLLSRFKKADENKDENGVQSQIIQQVKTTGALVENLSEYPCIELRVSTGSLSLLSLYVIEKLDQNQLKKKDAQILEAAYLQIQPRLAKPMFRPNSHRGEALNSNGSVR